jgi:hypothetical protein
MFDLTAEGRVINNLTVVDDATHEALAIVPERALGGLQLTRALDLFAKTRGLPKETSLTSTFSIAKTLGVQVSGNA